jgi:hypothetical protein
MLNNGKNGPSLRTANAALIIPVDFSISRSLASILRILRIPFRDHHRIRQALRTRHILLIKDLRGIKSAISLHFLPFGMDKFSLIIRCLYIEMFAQVAMENFAHQSRHELGEISGVHVRVGK